MGVRQESEAWHYGHEADVCPPLCFLLPPPPADPISSKWNYEKFLISRDGKVVDRWTSVTKPESLSSTIEGELAKPASAAQ